jgi:hypothetical protein
MSHHRAALLTIAAAAVMDTACGLLYSAAEHVSTGHALFCAVGNAVTEGACTTPATTAGHWIDLAEFLLVVPLFGAAFSLFTSGLTGSQVREHVRASESRVKQHVEDRLAEHRQPHIAAKIDALNETVAGFADGVLALLAARVKDEPAATRGTARKERT